MSNMIDVRDLKRGQQILVRPGVVGTVTASTEVDFGGAWATVYTSVGNFGVKLPSRAQLAD
ncbi:hypothetical protein SK571_40850 [Lentzea sp. BCCO 10_0798]|uniref:Uncharacterized protein n=1 Tax=Lentzea kristufekii TaxID=3095430 RepID=A0ABU4U5B4_9PSEU|nr:hypothetical protein [Lentzea sp. BCCO 10_0798]MDX8055764.1 hypothetical protein [Lentzea sp. BCCO 10_0798]